MGSTELEWSILLTDDVQVRQLNHTYRGIDCTTDVLSFPQADEEPLPGVPPLLGDVVVSVEQAARQAPDGDLEAELTRLLVHGACHLHGHDHNRAAEATAMATTEDKLLALFSLSTGLTSRAHP